MRILNLVLFILLLCSNVCFGAGSAAINSDQVIIVTGVVADGDDYDVFADTDVVAVLSSAVISYVTWSGGDIAATNLCEVHDASGNVLIPIFTSVDGDEAFSTPYLGLIGKSGSFLINQMDHGIMHIFLERVLSHP